MKIMRYRAELINAHLSFGPAEQGGTVVTCKHPTSARDAKEQE